ncbi:DUF5320 domain-containing protein [Desulfurococcus mucosus]|uniref:DUF5320 domain-containing protein n=1 Tax=Desulfurococcus mucosus (strain ATCC 35584 / DSM 2162 / JCM 9187 / O7/1) TaxID=765177 RepID=E8RA82_DESM0|nr:DUF5320 domain-containing protein [Desulfurococcus mucosus]ADV65388.1 hypothetical protein Desmu_1086 [Desulfurococcus mucosus DSM 2162]
MGWWNRWWKPYPGNGPFSHLPPWERPGWVLFGSYRWYGGYVFPPGYYWGAQAADSERAWLEYRKAMIENTIRALNEELSYIDRRLKELGSTGK